MARRPDDGAAVTTSAVSAQSECYERGRDGERKDVYPWKCIKRSCSDHVHDNEIMIYCRGSQT